MSTALREIPGWYIEFQAALLRQAPRPGEIDQKTAEKWTGGQIRLKESLANCLLSETSVEPARPEPLLHLVESLNVPATLAPFIAKEKFIVDTNSAANVPIGNIERNFELWFLTGKGKIENPLTERTLHYAKLLKASQDGPILDELGGVDNFETTLSELFFLMELQKDGRYGPLLNNSQRNLFYIRDTTDVIRTVCVCSGALWLKHGWVIGADLIRCPHRKWNRGSRVFYRNPTPASSGPLAPAQA